MKLPSLTHKRRNKEQQLQVVTSTDISQSFAEPYYSDGSSTFLVEEENHLPKNTSPTPPRRRRVSFCDSPSPVYCHSPTRASEDDDEEETDASACWYTQAEIKMFKTETVYIAKAIIRATARQEVSWIQCLQHAYNVFCDHPEEMSTQAVLTPHTKATASILGLDKWVLRAMAADKAHRRGLLMDRIVTLDDPRVVAKVSSFLSQPSRQYAAHVAQWWWDSEQQPQ
uniref:Uncharacterized protein n=1 Tax=Amphora coffeiformis TaxID=265554 RepID=A0A7S3L0C1_9STRA|mmetsp:Transcript_14025/g.26889  ORF Transcript_14025/g.26889 Transcript_14025/m.26889 type:complete len:226 (+) Transcript_14025:116-793(+)|eukprot:scaffold1684_cov214-Amphora_coffeaeformis.AAC.17